MELNGSTGGQTLREAFPDRASYMGGQVFTDVDKSGRVWIASYDWLGCYDPSSATLRSINLPEDSSYTTAAAEAFVPSLVTLGRITSMGLDDAGNVWLTRDFRSVLEEYEPSSSVWVDHPAPEGTVVPDRVTMTASGPLIADRRPTSSTGLTNYGVLSGSDSSWHRLQTSDVLIGSDTSGAALFASPELTQDAGVLASGTDSISDAGFRWPTATVGATGSMPNGIVALGRDGDIWYVSGLDLACYNDKTGRDVIYALPRVEAPGHGVGHGLSFVRPVHGMPQAESSGTSYIAPAITNAAIDGDGNLWFSYAAGFRFAGEALRP